MHHNYIILFHFNVFWVSGDAYKLSLFWLELNFTASFFVLMCHGMKVSAGLLAVVNVCVGDTGVIVKIILIS